MNIKDKVESFGWCRSSGERLGQELDRWLDEGLSIPLEPGGWWHQYVCPTHHTELEFDPFERDADHYRCPQGCRLEGEPYRGAWLVFKHQSLARYALQSATVYAATKDSKYADAGKSILVQYARQFPLYPVHPDAQPWMLKGRAFHQALTEAIWATTLFRAYLLLLDEGVDFTNENTEIDSFLSMLEESMVQYRNILIHEKKTPESNYTAWLNAALAGVYAIRGDKNKLNGLIDGEGGFIHHLSICVLPDQFEFEGSTYYHVFVLRAYLITAEMAKRSGIDLFQARGEQGQSLAGMLDVLAALANDQGELPALHDGPYRRLPYAREIAEVFEIGYDEFGKPEYIPILACANRIMYGNSERQGLEAVVFGSGNMETKTNEMMPTRSSILLPDAGFALGRHAMNDLSFVTDFGPHGGSHGHYDKLHLSIHHRLGDVAPDFGMVPYGSSFRQDWFAETVSHNTVIVGGQSQAPHTGRCMKYEESAERVYVWVRSDAAYEGCSIDRHFLLTSDWLLDWVEVSLQQEQQVDLPVHLLAEEVVLRSVGTLDVHWDRTADRTLGETGGYAHLRVRESMKSTELNKDQSIHLCYRLSESKDEATVSISTLLRPNSTLYKLSTPGTSVNPVQKIQSLLHRQIGRRLTFVNVYRSGVQVAGLTWNDVSQYAEITTESVRQRYHVVEDVGLVQIKEESS